MPKRHVFLFRHCVRSVGEEINFHDNTTSTLYSKNPLDYLPQWPAWNTPPRWCTAVGADIMKGTGAFLFRRLHMDDNENRRITFVSDISPRDVQTALALMSGMAQENAKQTNHTDSSFHQQPTLKGLDSIEIDPRLFHPFAVNKGFQSASTTQICTTPPVKDTIQAIQDRLQNIPPPASFSSTMQWMKEQIGVDLFHVFEKDHQDPGNVTLGPDGTHFAGAFNLFKYVAQSVFYARASGIVETGFWQNVTIDELYQLLAWVHWSRNVINVGNNLAAANGGVLLARIFQALEQTQDNDVTFIIGHDGNLDAVATAMGISWNLSHPYHPGYTPTPPGSAIHFAYDGNEVEISFMAPIFFRDQSLELNSTGILSEVPVKFDSFHPEIKGGLVTVVSSLRALRAHIVDVLETYQGSLECFEAAEKTSSQPSLILIVLGGLLIFAMTIATYCCCRRRKLRRDSMKQPQGQIQQYSGIAVEMDIELT